MKYGHFSKDGKEYIITRPDTPRPWFNYLFNDLYHALISQSGGGFSYYEDPKTNRILRYDHLETDRPGRYVFLRDEDSRDIWTINWQPLRKKLDSWTCYHGLGYTRIISRHKGVEGEITYFVAQDAPLEIWLVRLKNKGRNKRRLKIFPFVELISGDISMEVCYRNIMRLYNQAYYDPKLKAILAYKHPYLSGQERRTAFFSIGNKIQGYDCRKQEFLGRYNDIQKPEAVEKGKCRNSAGRGEDMVAVFESKLTLAANEEKEFVVVLGFAGGRKEIPGLLKKYQDVKKAKQELAEIKDYWQGITETLKVDTPDPWFNTMINIWGKYQLFAVIHSRGTSAYHGAEGGLGYRDTAQDSEGLLSVKMESARKKLEKLFYYQYKSGHAVSGFSDTEGSWDSNGDNVVTGKADVAVWLPFTVVSYLKETGDFEFLNKKYAFHDGSKATVYERIIRAIRYIYKERGKHGLPYIRKADWNDAYDHVGIKGKGESIWLGMALARACKQVGELAEFIGDKDITKEMQGKYKKLREIINSVGWDGNWYLAAYNDQGLKIGSKENQEGKVPLNSQTWAILSGVVPPERKAKILDKIDNYLDTKYGPVLFWPSYNRFNPGIGRVTAFAQGTKENAAIFSHACAFKIVADCLIKRGDKAYETLKKLYPMSPAKQDHNKYKVEPYIWAEYVVGPGSKHRFGEGAFTWNTGTTPWAFIAATEWILGARRDFGGLLIDPCIPHHWKKCFIRRPFRGAVYEISIKNPSNVQSGVKEISVDGRKQNSSLIKPHGDGRVHKVEVVMG